MPKRLQQLIAQAEREAKERELKEKKMPQLQLQQGPKGAATAASKITTTGAKSPQKSDATGLTLSAIIGDMSSPELSPQDIQKLQEAGYKFRVNLTIEPPAHLEPLQPALSDEGREALSLIQQNRVAFDVDFKPSQPKTVFKPENNPQRPSNFSIGNSRDESLPRLDTGGGVSESLLKNYQVELRPTIAKPMQGLSPAPQNHMLPVDELAKRANVTPRTVWRHIAEGRVETMKRTEPIVYSSAKTVEKVYGSLPDLMRSIENSHPGGRRKNKI